MDVDGLIAECRDAVVRKGPRSLDWADKPHRLVYDLCTALATLRDERDAIAKVERTTGQMDRLFIGAGEYVRATDAVAAVTTANKARSAAEAERDRLRDALREAADHLEELGANAWASDARVDLEDKP